MNPIETPGGEERRASTVSPCPGGYVFPFTINPEWRKGGIELPYPILFSTGLTKFPFTNIVPPGNGSGSPVPFYSYEGYEGEQKIGIQTSPVLVSWWAFKELESGNHEAFLRMARWLRENAISDELRGRIWPMNFRWVEQGMDLTPPWPNAMAQGMAMSVYTRAYRLTGERFWAEECLQGVRLFRIRFEDGGVLSTFSGKGTFYEMYPGPESTVPHVLDGFCFALFGLYEASLLEPGSGMGDEIREARRLFEEGMQTLGRFVSLWDFHGVWSYYGNYGYLASNLYHTLNRLWLDVLGRIAGSRRLVELADQWNPERWGRDSKENQHLVRQNLIDLYVRFQLSRTDRRRP